MRQFGQMEQDFKMIDASINEVWAGLTGLLSLYVLLIGLLSWFVIGAKGKWWAKGVMIAASLWFGFTLFHSMHNFMGWPTLDSIKQSRSQIIFFQIREPSKKFDDPGAIYIWARIMRDKEEPNELTFAQLLDPMHLFKYTDTRAPRAFKLPYTKETHKQLEDLAKDQKQKGSQGYVEKETEEEEGGEQRTGQDDRSSIRIMIVDPADLLKKKKG